MAETSNPKTTHTVRLESIRSEDRGTTMTMGVHTPGLIAWAKAGFDKRNPAVADALAESFRVQPSVMVALLSGAVPYTVDGDSVVFEWPCDRLAEVVR